MPDPKTYWAIINDVPTECTIWDTIYGGTTCIVHPLDKPEDVRLSLRQDFVHATKASCIQQALEIFARYYSEGERDIKQRQMQQAQLFHKMEALKKELEECDAEG